jgi:hypothetical protein
MPRDVRLDSPDPDSREGLIGSFGAMVGRLARAAMGPVGPDHDVRESLLVATVWHEEAARQLASTPGPVPEPDSLDARALESGEGQDFEEVCRRYQRSSSALAGTLYEIPAEEFTADRPTGQWVRALTRRLTTRAQELETSAAS